MIKKVKKIVFYGLKKEIDKFFKTVQKEGFIEFIGLSSKKKAFQMPLFLKNFIFAIKILKKIPLQGEKEKKEVSLLDLSEEVVNINKNIDYLKNELAQINNKISLIAPFGKFSKQDLSYIEKETGYHFYFYTKKTKKVKKNELIRSDEDLIFLTTEYDLDYFVSITKKKKPFLKGFVEIDIDDPIDVLQKKALEIEKEIEKKFKKLKAYTPYLEDLNNEFIGKLNIYNLESAIKDSKSALDENLFLIEAWVPENKFDRLNKLLESFDIEYEKIAVDKEENIPTFMENKNLGKIGEDLVKIYDTPNVQDKDPSMWVLIFFSIFFAMIISDAGYGLIYLLIAIFMKWKIKKPKPSIVRLNKLIFLLSFSCIFWGVLSLSFFGINFKFDSKFQKISVFTYLSEKKANYHLKQKDDVYLEYLKKYPKVQYAKNGTDFLKFASKNNVFEAKDLFSRNILMELAILLGVIHVSLAFLRNLKFHFAGIGWVLFIIGGYLFFPSILQATSLINFMNILSTKVATVLGKYLLFTGIASAIIFALIQDRKKGIREITNIVGIFGDVLSYLRLYALALAGMILSQTFNQIAFSMNIFIGVFVIIIGHGINMALGILGGIIHGLRLNFLEWYNHCFQGGGKLFNPLKLLK